mgnify:FL=1
MKRIVYTYLILLLLLCLCSGLAEDDTIVIKATTYPLYDMARSLYGDPATVTFMPDASTDTLGQCDILLCVGDENDQWTAFLDGVTVVRALDSIGGLLTIDGNVASLDTPIEEIDADVLTIPINDVLVAYDLVDAVTMLNADIGTAATDELEDYANQYFEMDRLFVEAVENGAAVTCHDGSMNYFAQEYGVDVDQEGAVELHTYNMPGNENLEVPYIELMQRNLQAIKEAN